MQDPTLTDHHPRCAQQIDHASRCTCERETDYDRATGGQGYPPPQPDDRPETPWNYAPRLVWRPTTTNTKTGRIPTAAVHPDHVEQSCQGCALYPARCYAWRGRIRQGFQSMSKALRRRQAEASPAHPVDYRRSETPPAYTLAAAIAGRQWVARYVRLTSIGCASVCSDHELREVRDDAHAAGLGVLGYLAHWARLPERRRWLAGMFLASTQTDKASDTARRSGWLVAQAVDPQRFADAMEAGHIETADGHRLKLCDHQQAELSDELPPTCNSCGFCSVPELRASGYDGVALAEHGPTARGKAWTELVRAARAGGDA